ncbi:MAG: chemotaxis protein CheX [Bacteriovorax sp.]|nr:chemotaxis protein CheX [Bacteriovorax sp.]
MEFIRNILIIDKFNDQVELIKKQILSKSNKFSVFTLNSRLQIAEIASKNDIKCLFLNANIGKVDTFYILRFFEMLKEKNNVDIPIFFTSEDFDLMQEALAKFTKIKLQILHTPLDINDLVEKIQVAILGKSTLLAKSKTSKNSLSVDVEFMNVFITSSKKVIAEMAQLSDLVHGAPILMAQLKIPLDIAISAKILISSAYFKGSYYIAFPKQTFLNFYEVAVMEKTTEINEENKDFAGELANIIYGQCKKKFSDEGFNLDMVIPSIHLGEIKYSVVILIPFESSLGKFYLAIAPGLI